MKIVDDTFVYWAKEREWIRRSREKGMSSPWTADPILRDYRFCNVSREDDSTTVWIRKYIREPFDLLCLGDEELFRVIALARFINLPWSLEKLLSRGCLNPGAPNYPKIVETVLGLQNASQKVFSPAYMVRGNKGEPKIKSICDWVQNAKLPDTSSREAFTKGLAEQKGFGMFMAGQVAADLAYTRILTDAPDHMTWAPVGPGAIRGMNRALGRPIGSSITEKEYLEVGRRQLELLPRSLVEDRKLTLHDVASNVNCETDKYLRIQGSEGNTRRFP